MQGSHDHEESGENDNICTYCDKSFLTGDSLIQHLCAHMDGSAGGQAIVGTTCPITCECKHFDISKESLSSHILYYHPEHAKKLQLKEAMEDLSLTVTRNELYSDSIKGVAMDPSLQGEHLKQLGASTTPVCTVKPLPPISSRLVEDLADTVSAIEAICSINNGKETPSQLHEHPQTRFIANQDIYHNALSEHSSNEENSVFENKLQPPNQSKVIIICIINILVYIVLFCMSM